MAESFEVAFGSFCRCQPGYLRLYGLPELKKLPEADALLRHDLGKRSQQIAAGRQGNIGAVASAAFEHTTFLQGAYGLAQRTSGNLENFCEIALGRKPVSGAYLSRIDKVANSLDHLFIYLGLPHFVRLCRHMMHVSVVPPLELVKPPDRLRVQGSPVVSVVNWSDHIMHNYCFPDQSSLRGYLPQNYAVLYRWARFALIG